MCSSGEIQRKTLRRAQVSAFFARAPRGVVAMEACGSAHHWARLLQSLGHEVKLIAAQFVRPFVKTNKTDAADAQAIWEAAQRPDMRFVAVKSEQQQAVLSLHRLRASVGQDPHPASQSDSWSAVRVRGGDTARLAELAQSRHLNC